MSRTPEMNRRQLLQGAAVAAGGWLLAGDAGQPPASQPRLPTRRLGRSGREVCMLALGTGQLAHKLEFDDAVAVVRHALDAGVTYIDTARDYGSERHVGAAIQGRRDGLFLATKTLQRTYDGAMRELEQSLKDLGTQRLDLWQVHSIGHERETGAEALAALRQADSVMKAMRRARADGTVGLIGFTGHTKPDYMLELLAAADLDFDTVLFVLGPAVARDDGRGWEERVLPAAREKELGLIAMKVFGGGSAVGQGDQQADPASLLRYVWERGVAAANVGLYTTAQVDAAVAALRAYARLQPRDGEAAPADLDRDFALRRRLAGVQLPFTEAGYRDGYGAHT